MYQSHWQWLWPQEDSINFASEPDTPDEYPDYPPPYPTRWFSWWNVLKLMKMTVMRMTVIMLIIFTMQVWRGDDARFQSILQLLPWWRPMLVALCRWPRKCLHLKTKIRFGHISPPLQIWRERMRRGSWLARTSSILDPRPIFRLIRDWLRWHWLGALLAKVLIFNFNSVWNLAPILFEFI